MREATERNRIEGRAGRGELAHDSEAHRYDVGPGERNLATRLRRRRLLDNWRALLYIITYIFGALTWMQ